MSSGVTYFMAKQTNPVRLMITGGKVSQQETRQAKQYSPNSYHTEYNFDLSEPVDVTDLPNVAAVSRQANALLGLCTIANRKSEKRDGIQPFICSEFVGPELVKIGTEQEWVKNEIASISAGPVQTLPLPKSKISTVDEDIEEVN